MSLSFLAAVYKVEGLKRDFNAHNKLIGQYRKVTASCLLFKALSSAGAMRLGGLLAEQGF